jgi:hypothetical protein
MHDAASSQRSLLVAAIQARVDSKCVRRKFYVQSIIQIARSANAIIRKIALHSLRLCQQCISNVRAFVGGNPTKKQFNLNRLSEIDTAWWKKFRLALTLGVNVGQRNGCRRKSGEGSYRCEATPNVGRSLHKVRFTLVVRARHRGKRSLHSRHHSDILWWLPRRSARQGRSRKHWGLCK